MNLYTLRHRNLNPACLPVPPYPHPIKSSALFQTMKVSYTIFVLNATGDRYRFTRFQRVLTESGLFQSTVDSNAFDVIMCIFFNYFRNTNNISGFFLTFILRQRAELNTAQSLCKKAIICCYAPKHLELVPVPSCTLVPVPSCVVKIGS